MRNLHPVAVVDGRARFAAAKAFFPRRGGSASYWLVLVLTLGLTVYTMYYSLEDALIEVLVLTVITTLWTY